VERKGLGMKDGVKNEWVIGKGGRKLIQTSTGPMVT